jgi:hypothetical protein
MAKIVVKKKKKIKKNGKSKGTKTKKKIIYS